LLSYKHVARLDWT